MDEPFEFLLHKSKVHTYIITQHIYDNCISQRTKLIHSHMFLAKVFSSIPVPSRSIKFGFSEVSLSIPGKRSRLLLAVMLLPLLMVLN